MSTAPVYVSLSEANVRHVKRALAARFDGVKSSHLTEALAAALGRRTNAALLSDLRAVRAPELVPLNEAAFATRLSELTGQPVPSPRTPTGLFHELAYPEGAEVVRTWSPGFERVRYRSERIRAWRNMMVAAINAGINQRLFSVRKGDNRWPGAGRGRDRSLRAHRYRFAIAGIPALAAVDDGGFDELRIFVAFWPSAEAERWVDVAGWGFKAGDARASGWVERRDAAYVQVPLDFDLACRRARLTEVAAVDVKPCGYADRGTFRL